MKALWMLIFVILLVPGCLGPQERRLEDLEGRHADIAERIFEAEKSGNAKLADRLREEDRKLVEERDQVVPLAAEERHGRSTFFLNTILAVAGIGRLFIGGMA